MRTPFFAFVGLLLTFTVLFLNTGCEKETLVEQIPAEATETDAATLQEAQANDVVESREGASLTGFRAWAWADQPNAISYTPATSYQFNSASSARITIRRNSTGDYTVSVPNAAAHYDGIAHTTAYGGNHTSQVAFWSRVGTTLNINVRVFSANGSPFDGRFVVFFYREPTHIANYNSAYQWNNSSLYSFNSKGRPNTLTRTGLGTYNVTFNGIIPNIYRPGELGTVLATAYGALARRVQVVRWTHTGSQVTATVKISDINGTPVDGAFNISYISDFRIGQQFVGEDTDYGAYVWNNCSASSSCTPERLYQNINTSSTPITSQRLSTGNYKITLPFMVSTGATMAIATPYGNSGNYVSVAGWGRNSTGGVDVFVRCYSPSGVATDGAFSLFYYTNTNVLF